MISCAHPEHAAPRPRRTAHAGGRLVEITDRHRSGQRGPRSAERCRWLTRGTTVAACSAPASMTTTPRCPSTLEELLAPDDARAFLETDWGRRFRCFEGSPDRF